MIASFEALKAFSSSAEQENLWLGLRKGLNGVIVSRSWAEFANWLTSPNQLRMSVVDVGVGKSLMASRYLGRGSMDESETRNPAKDNGSFGELELIRIQHNASLANAGQEVDGTPSVLLDR